MKKPVLKIFSDFDGTITKNDVWHSSLASFVNDRNSYKKILDEYHDKKISAQELNVSLLNLIENFTFEEFNKKLDEEEIDLTFIPFADYFKKNNFDLFVLSGGYDYYIKYILKKHGINVKLFSNILSYSKISNSEYYTLSCEFPHSDEHCTYCDEISKTNILINNTNEYEGEVSVYIGDNTSDFCAAQFADIVFAKNKLASHCWKNNITYFEYTSFADIQAKLEKLLKANKIKQRQNAKTLRKDVLLGG